MKGEVEDEVERMYVTKRDNVERKRTGDTWRVIIKILITLLPCEGSVVLI